MNENAEIVSARLASKPEMARPIRAVSATTAPNIQGAAVVMTSFLLMDLAVIEVDLPNVKDEPRRELARRVERHDSLSAVSRRSSFGRTRRDRSQRWLRRLVMRLCGCSISCGAKAHKASAPTLPS
jgi:hypothetical protein